MAPMAPMGRKSALESVKKGRFPVWLGAPHPKVMILEQDGLFRIRQLVIDEARAKAESEAALAEGEAWMPEQYYGLGEPLGEIYVEAKTRDELIAKMKEISWPEDW